MLHAACHLGCARYKASMATTPQLFYVCDRADDAKRLLGPGEPFLVEVKVRQVEWLLKSCPRTSFLCGWG